MKTVRPINFEIALLKDLDDYLYESKIKSRSRFVCEAVREKLIRENFIKTKE